MWCILVLFSLLQLSSSTINCRISCRRCREKTDHPELLEVYCAMCTECKERRREWLQGAPSVSIRNEESHPLQTDHQDSDDCIPPICEDPCEEESVFLTGSPEKTTPTTTTSTTTTTTTTTTTRRPCLPKPKCITPVCCAQPVISLMPMCTMCDVNRMPKAVSCLEDHTTKISGGSMYLYLGVPKPLLNELNLKNKTTIVESR